MIVKEQTAYGVICFFETSNSVEALSSAAPLPTRYTLWLTEVRWWYPSWPARPTVHWTWEGCHAPIQATLRRPLCVFLGSFLVPHLLVTPLKP